MYFFLQIVIFIVGLLLLVWSSDFLIQSSVKLAFLFKLTPLFVGVVLVAFGTSAPELAVCIIAAIRGENAIALGNIIGSNISNIGLVLGVCAILIPLKVNKSILKREMLIVIFSVFLLYFLLRDLFLSRMDGLILIICFCVFCIFSYKKAKSKEKDSKELNNFCFKGIFKKVDSKLMSFVIFFIALIGIVAGANLMVGSGVKLAKLLGISSWIIGITVFAIGTSLPELAASLTASFKKVPSISIGNIIGSNIFNIFLVLGIVAIVNPFTVTEGSMLFFEMPALLFFSFILFIFLRTRYEISRKEGFFLVIMYIAFIVFLIIK